MEDINGYAEQCKDWSEEFTTDFNGDVAYAAARNRQATTCLHPTGHSWLTDYAVHTLWQTPLSLCDRTRAWPQVLSLSEQSWPTPDTDLRSPHHGGAGAGAVGPTTEGSHARRRAVRHWVRVTHAPGGHVTKSDVADQLACGGVCDRYHGCQSPRGQHAGARRERSTPVHVVTAGGIPCARR